MPIDLVDALRQRFSTYLAYEVLFKILALAVLGPVSALIGSYFISTTGYASLSNERSLCYLLILPGFDSYSRLLMGLAGFRAGTAACMIRAH